MTFVSLEVGAVSLVRSVGYMGLPLPVRLLVMMYLSLSILFGPPCDYECPRPVRFPRFGALWLETWRFPSTLPLQF